MVAITFESVSKNYGDNTVIRTFNAEVGDNEFLVLLGPSGCGKSTMLRMIAGLIDITSGSIRFDGKEVNDLHPKERGIAFVFQSYALYPHMTVGENIAFPLVMKELKWWWHLPFASGIMRRRLAKRADIAEAVQRTAALLELSDFLDRRPRALSGGQRQRVAVARSIVREPSVYLFDEPLSNLDAKLRMQMRAEISALHSRVGKSFVYVTHDQVEAMTMGTKIILLNDGVVQQFGTPKEIYAAPANRFVARFIGAPPTNVFTAQVSNGELMVDGHAMLGAQELISRLTSAGIAEVDVGVRAEKVTIGESPTTGRIALPAHVTVTEHLGAETVIGLKFGDPGSATAIGAAASRRLHYARVPGEVTPEPESPCFVNFDLADVHLFDRETGKRLEI